MLASFQAPYRPFFVNCGIYVRSIIEKRFMDGIAEILGE
jgi:hypothetical protein